MTTIPEWLSWTDVVLSLIAFLLAVIGIPTFLQMYWGKAHLCFEFDRHVENEKRALLIYFKNPRITSKTLSFLGVRREPIQSLTVMFCIAESGTGRIIDPVRHARIYSDGDPDDNGLGRVGLPPTLSVAASIVAIHWDVLKKVAVVPADRLRPPLELQAGQYRMDLTFSVNGKPEYASRIFVVGQKADDLIWSRN